jgi:hypothetical protein
MPFVFNRLTRPVRLLLAVLLMGLVPAAAHAAKWYVDNTLGEVKPEEKVLPKNPKAVQVIYEFQRDGAAHARATKETRGYALAALTGTGAFASVAETPVAEGAVLTIRFNNVVKKEEMDKAKKDGFRAGLGFGLFGGVVATDYYVVTLEYVAAPGAAPIVTTVNHALHMKFGKKDVEIPGTEVKGVKLAVETVVRQALARGVNNIVSDPAFPQ